MNDSNGMYLKFITLFAISVGYWSLAFGQDLILNVYHYSDYHSHAIPFFSEGKPSQGGIARVFSYLRSEKSKDHEALIINGGDSMNRGSPSYSDKFQCQEWSWYNGLCDAMALGNHEFDYGFKVFEECRKKIKYPIVNATLVGISNRKPFFNIKGKPYLILKRKGLRIGLFAVSGSDFPTLISKQNMPENTEFQDPILATRLVVEALRKENVNAI
ncbi:MAG: metallophosphoesterase, partial [Bdellovibrionota bacterium]